MARGEKPNQIVHRLINEERKRRRLPWVRWNQEMYLLAKGQANRMAKEKHLSHSNRYALRGGECCWGGEGYHASGERLAKEIFKSWMASSKHRAWLLDRRVKTAGTAITSSRTGTYATWAFSDQPLHHPKPSHRAKPSHRPTKTAPPRFSWAKLLAALGMPVCLATAAWTGYLAYTHRTGQTGTLAFLASVGLSIWLLYLLSRPKYKRSKPSFKLVWFSLVGIALLYLVARIV